MNLIEQALDFSKKGNIEEWVYLFLLGEGKNTPLSEGLRKQKRYWIGPIEIELSLLPTIVGYESHKEYKESLESWNRRISSMIKDIETGWIPAPLIAEYRKEGLSLRDGNHRQGALVEVGFKKYHTIIWFNSKEDFEAWSLKQIPTLPYNYQPQIRF